MLSAPLSTAVFLSVKIANQLAQNCVPGVELRNSRLVE